VGAKDLSLLIVDEDDRMRQVLASLLSDRCQSVTTAAFAELGSSIVLESFDMILVPRSESNLSKEAAGLAETGIAASAIKSGVTGNLYDLRAIKYAASKTVLDPFERVLIQVAIENSDFACRQIERITKRDAIF